MGERWTLTKADIGTIRIDELFPQVKVKQNTQEKHMSESILGAATKSVSEMTPEEIKAEFLKLQVQQTKRKELQAKYNADPEKKEARKQYSEKYRKENPEKFLEARKAYNEKPEVKAKRKAYMKTRYDRNKAILAKAVELGLLPKPAASPVSEAPDSETQSEASA